MGENLFYSLFSFEKMWKIQRIFKIYKGKFSHPFFYLFFVWKQLLCQNRMHGCDCWGPDGHLDTKIDQLDLCHICMSYASYDIKCHIMTNDAYDIEIWHMRHSSSLVSKRPSEPHQSHLFIRFWLKNCLKIQKLKNALEIFSLYKFWKSFVFFGRTWGQIWFNFHYS